MSQIHGISIGQLAHWLGSAKARNGWLMAWVTLYPVAVGALQAPPEGFQLPIQPWLWDILLGGGIALVLLIANLLRLKPKLITNLMIWLFAGVVGAYLPIIVSGLLGKDVDVLQEAAPLSVISNTGLLMIFTILQATAGEYRHSIRDLEDKIWKLNNRSLWLSTELQNHNAELSQNVFSRIQPELVQVRKLVESGQFNTAHKQLSALNQEIVRPISNQLNQSDFRFESAPRKKAGFLAWFGLDASSFKNPIPLSVILSPWLTVLFGLVFLVAGASISDPIYGAGFFLGYLFGLGALLLLVRRWTQNVSLITPFLLLSSVIVAASINYLYVSLNHFFGLANISGMAEFVALGLSLIFLGTALISIYLEGMRKTNERALELAVQLSESVGELQVRIMAIRRRLAIRVHGDLQARLQGLLVLLSRFEQLNHQEKQHFFDELEQCQKLFSDSESQPVSTISLEQLAVQWQGICEVNVTFGEGVEDKLQQDSGLSELVFEIARERVINAVKHSGAEELDLGLEIRENLLIVRTLNVDFGAKKPDSRSPGTGSNLLDSACRSWHLKIESGVAVFEAEIELFETRG